MLIAEANRIFGFDGWQRQAIAVRCVAQAARTIGRDQKPGWGVSYTARVRVTVNAGGLPSLIREGTGAGHGNRCAEAPRATTPIWARPMNPPSRRPKPTPCSRRPAQR